MNKILSFFLSFLLLMSILSVTAFAEDEIGTTMEYEIQEDGTAMITYFDSLDSVYDIPSEIDGYTVTAIGNKAFYSCHTLTKVTVPDTVLTVGDRAFDTCNRLTTVTLGSGVKSIGYRAFGGCKVLNSINLPDGLVTIGNNAFSGCKKLPQISIPASVTSIGNYAFMDCYNMQNITIENGDMTIGVMAFSWCMGVTTITLGSNIKSIGNNAFVACDSVTSITIENPDCDIYDSENTLPENAVIYGYADSTAQTYAEKYGKTFVALGEPVFDYTLGDVDNDEKITIMDATMIQRYLADLTDLTDEQKLSADVDKDTYVTIIDATVIQRYVAQYIEEF